MTSVTNVKSKSDPLSQVIKPPLKKSKRVTFSDEFNPIKFIRMAVKDYACVNDDEKKKITIKLSLADLNTARILSMNLLGNDQRTHNKLPIIYTQNDNFVHTISEVAIRHLFDEKVIKANKIEFSDSVDNDITHLDPWQTGELVGNLPDDEIYKCVHYFKDRRIEIVLDQKSLRPDQQQRIQEVMKELFPGKLV